MTLQELLTEATHLSLKEQLQLATQLLYLVNCQLTNSHSLDTLSSTNLDDKEGSIGYLMSHPIPVNDFKPLSRDEIFQR
jgi:hypothetical protein